MFKLEKNVKLSGFRNCIKNHRAEYWFVYLVEILGAFCAKNMLCALTQTQINESKGHVGKVDNLWLSICFVWSGLFVLAGEDNLRILKISLVLVDIPHDWAFTNNIC